MFARWILLAGLAVPCASPGLLAGSQQQFLDQTLSNHRTARESIHTFYCRVSLTHNSEKHPFLQGEYWRSPDAIRIRSHGDNISEDVLVQNARLKAIIKEATPRGEEVRGAIGQLNQPLGQCDVWALSLQTFIAPEGGWVTLDELLEGPHKLKAVERRKEGDRELIYIDLEHKMARLEIWLDPHVNYLARKMYISSLTGVKTRGESEVVRFKEAEPGIYFPEQVETRGYYNNNLTGITTKTFADIRINQSLSPDALKFHFPSGVKVLDSIQGKFYTVDSEGRPTGEVRNMQVVRTPPLPVGGNPPTATEFEPESLTRWILPSSLGILTVGIIAWLIRKRKA